MPPGGGLQLPCILPAAVSAMDGPGSTGQVQVADGKVVPSFKVMELPVGVQVAAAQSAKFPEQIARCPEVALEVELDEELFSPQPLARRPSITIEATSGAAWRLRAFVGLRIIRYPLFRQPHGRPRNLQDRAWLVKGKAPILHPSTGAPAHARSRSRPNGYLVALRSDNLKRSKPRGYRFEGGAVNDNNRTRQGVP